MTIKYPKQAVAAITALGLLACAAVAQAQGFPSKPVTLVVPFPAGGVVDVLGRSVGEKMSQNLGVPVIVENRTGAGGTIGATFVAKAQPDGHTILLGGSATQIFAPALIKNVPYDPMRSFVAVGQISAGPLVVTVGPRVKSSDIAGALQELRAQGVRAFYGSNGNGTFPHLAAEMLKQSTGMTMAHIPYSGGPAASTALVSGDIWVSVNHIPVVQGLVKSGRLRALATTGQKRSAAYPDLPTLQEAGIRNFEATAWFGLFAPAGTPQQAIARISSALQAALKDPGVAARLAAQGDEPRFSTPTDFDKYVRAEAVKWTKVVKTANLTLD